MKPILPTASYFCTCCALVLLAFYLAACTQKPTPGPAFAKVNGQPTASADASQGRGADLQLIQSPRFPVIYFEYDSDRIPPADLDRLSSAVREVGTKWVCNVDGHASEEGTTDYNLALGLRRAYQVGTYIANFQGIQVHETSYGEEKPVTLLESWQWKNRRVEIVCK